MAINAIKIIILLKLIILIKVDTIATQNRSNIERTKSDVKLRDFNRILGDIAYNDDYEMHWGLAVVAVLPLVAIIIALLIWKFCKNVANGQNTEANRDPNRKRSLSNEESSY